VFAICPADAKGRFRDPLHARRRLGARQRPTHDRLVREFPCLGAAVAFVEYDGLRKAAIPSDRAGYATAQWSCARVPKTNSTPAHGRRGDSVGGT